MCGLRDISQRTVETADGDVGSSAPYGIDCEDGVVGALDANGTVTGVLPGHWAGAPVDETNANVTRVWVCETPEACLGLTLTLTLILSLSLSLILILILILILTLTLTLTLTRCR